MKIPIIQADYPLQVVNQPNVGLGAATAARASGQVIDLVGEVARQQGELREKEKIAQDTLTALEIDNQIRKETADLEQSFAMDSDYQNFDKKMAEGLKAIQSKIQLQDPSNALKISVQRSLNHYSNNLATSVASRKYKIINDRGQVAIGEFVDNAAEEYAATDDPTEKAIIKKKTEMQIRTMIDSNGVDPVWGENQIRGFEKYAKQRETDAADVAADKAIMANPAQAAINLRDRGYLPNLTPKQRQDKVEKAEATAKIQEHEAEQKLNKAKEDARKAVNQQIGNLYMAGDFTKAYALTQSSGALEGTEKRSWADAIKNASAMKPEQVDSKLETQEIVKVNDMISRNDPIDEITNYIIQSPNLKRSNKEQYINKLNTDYAADIKEARSLGLNTIKDQIIPKRGITSAFIQTPLETEAVSKAQLVFMDWLDTEQQSKRRPTRTEIIYKAMTIGSEYQVSIVQQIDFLKAEAARMKEEAAKAKTR